MLRPHYKYKSSIIPNSRPFPFLVIRSDWDSLKHHMADIHQQITKKTNSCSTDELWCIFRDGLQEGIRRFIPHKTAKSKDNFPWITADIRKMMRKRDKLYSRQKSSRTAENISQFKSLKHRVQREVRSAYWNYVESIIEPMDEEKPYEGMKRFWTLKKHARSDSGGITPLRDQGQLVSDARGKAEILNRQIRVGLHERPDSDTGRSIAFESIPDSSRHPYNIRGCLEAPE